MSAPENPEPPRTDDAVPRYHAVVGDMDDTGLSGPSVPAAAPVRSNLIPGYTLLSKLGSGSSATVYLAKNTEGRGVAIKILSAIHLAHREIRRRWEREVRTVLTLQHPHIVQGLSHGIAEGRPYVVMEFVAGETLAARLHRRGPFGDEETIAIARQALQALGVAHALGIVHRDVKPSNIIRTESGAIKLMDFGLARHTDDASITLQGAVLGTPAYISPEQARGDAAIDGRSDLYALGITVFHLATGEVPFSSLNTSLLLTKKVTADVPDVRRYRRDVGGPLAAFIAALSARERSQRPGSVREALELLDAALRGEVTVPEFRSQTLVRRTPLPARGPLEVDPALQTVVGDKALRSAPIFLRAGDVLFYEDETERSAYVLLSGSLEILRSGRRVATVDAPGAFVGEMSPLRQAPRSATVRALEETGVLKIAEDEFKAFLGRHPEMCFQLARVLAERLEETTRRYSEAEDRIARIRQHSRAIALELQSPRPGEG